MNHFRVLLAPIFPKDDFRVSRRFLKNSLLFCAWEGARLRVVAEEPDERLSAIRELLRSR